MNTPAVAFVPVALPSRASGTVPVARPGLARPPTSPLELAIRAAAGSAESTGRLVRAVSPNVRLAVRAILGAEHPDLDDAIQLALIAFIQALPAFRGDCEPAGYARVIAVRTAIATRKRERAARARRDDDAEPDETARPSNPGGPAWEADERRELVRDLLAELPDEQGETLALRVGLGLSIEEIAHETSVPVNTVKSRLRLAKERLRARIEKDAALRDAFDRR